MIHHTTNTPGITTPTNISKLIIDSNPSEELIPLNISFINFIIMLVVFRCSPGTCIIDAKS